MILKGAKRGGAGDLARHLMKAENEHIEIHEIRGFSASTLLGAFREAEAVSLGTRCTKPLFALALSPGSIAKRSAAASQAASYSKVALLHLSAAARCPG